MEAKAKVVHWQSTLGLDFPDDDTESRNSKEDDYPNETSVGSFMRNLLEKQLYTDVEFFSASTKESISAHRVVLAAKCDFFKTLLFGDKADEATGMKMQVEISNLSFGVFTDVVKYFYTDDIDFTNVSTVLDIYATAQSFTIQPLINLCEQYIEDLELTEDNVCSTLQVSNIKYAKGLKRRCIDYIKRNTLKVISSPDFEKCSYNTVREICDLQDLNLQSEVEIIDAVVRWINVKPVHAKNELKKSLLKCIRFLSFTPKELSEVIKNYPNLLEKRQALNMLMYLNNPKKIEELPEWLNRSQRKFSQEDTGFKRDRTNVGRIKIPLKPAFGRQEISELTSVLHMVCIKGFHQIKAVKFLLEDILSQSSVTLIIKILVLPRRQSFSFTKIMNSKESILEFEKCIFIRAQETFNLKAEIEGSTSCKFLQLDAEDRDFENEHFRCFTTIKPKRRRFFFIDEVEYGPRKLSLRDGPFFRTASKREKGR